jgi:hypothetical protein
VEAGKIITNPTGDNIPAADFDYLEEIWLNHNEIRPHRESSWNFLHVYDTGPAEEKLIDLYSQFCQYNFLELAAADMIDAAKKLYECCRAFSPFGTFFSLTSYKVVQIIKFNTFSKFLKFEVNLLCR